MIIAKIFIYTLYSYLALGALFALWFVPFGVNKLDEGMQHTSWKVRILLIPGSILLWTVLLNKYLNRS